VFVEGHHGRVPLFYTIDIVLGHSKVNRYK